MNLEQLNPGDIVYAATEIRNDGGIPEIPKDALIATPGNRGVVVNIGHLEENPKQELFRVRRSRAFQSIFILILLFSFIMLKPTLFLFIFFLAYVSIGPLNYLSKNRLFAEPTMQEQEEVNI